jgi:hypothetical protein
MSTFDRRKEGFEKKFALMKSRGSRPKSAATGFSGCGRPSGWGSPAMPQSLCERSGRGRF